MERDFLGLGSGSGLSSGSGSSSKNVSVGVKEETPDASKDSSALVRGSVMQWSFSNKVSAVLQFLSFKSAQEERPRKTAHDTLASSGFMTVSNADAFDSNKKPYSSIIQSNMIFDKQVGNQHYAMTPYSMQHLDAQAVHRTQEVKIFPVSNQLSKAISVTMNSSLLQSRHSSSGQNMVSNAIKPQPLGDIPLIAPVSVVPARSSVINTTDLRTGSRSSEAPAQLTIFYGGSVNVYDDVSPEKAQAIMLLAGNGTSTTQSKTRPTTQVQVPIHRPSMGDSYIGTKSHIASPCSGLQSPISVTSLVGFQAGGLYSMSELAVRAIGDLASPSNQPEPPKVSRSAGSAAAATVVSTGGLPQARKASLARFLEKRKERIMKTPYGVNQKSPECSIAGSDVVSFSVHSAGSSFPAIH